jgi:uncharacterized protein (DUF305 family)
MKLTTIAAAAAGLALGAAGAAAWAQMGHGGHGQIQEAHGGHGAHGGQAQAADPAIPYAGAWAESMERMHADMDVALTGDADIDFVRGMIPHHMGAVAMAQIVLAHGADPEIRALAEAIVAAQGAEIAQMRAWLAARGY